MPPPSSEPKIIQVCTNKPKVDSHEVLFGLDEDGGLWRLDNNVWTIVALNDAARS